MDGQRDAGRAVGQRACWDSLTHSEEEGAGEDGGQRTSAGHQHGQHAGSEHQLLCQRRHHLVPQPAHVTDAQRPEPRVCVVGWRGRQGGQNKFLVNSVFCFFFSIKAHFLSTKMKSSSINSL